MHMTVFHETTKVHDLFQCFRAHDRKFEYFVFGFVRIKP